MCTITYENTHTHKDVKKKSLKNDNCSNQVPLPRPTELEALPQLSYSGRTMTLRCWVSVYLALPKSHLAGWKWVSRSLPFWNWGDGLVMSEAPLESFLPCFEEYCAFSPSVCWPPLHTDGLPARSPHLHWFLGHTDAGPQCFSQSSFAFLTVCSMDGLRNIQCFLKFCFCFSFPFFTNNCAFESYLSSWILPYSAKKTHLAMTFYLEVASSWFFGSTVKCEHASKSFPL